MSAIPGPQAVSEENRSVAVGAGLVTLGRGVGGGLAILTTVCLARTLPPPLFAVVAAVHLLHQTAQAVGTLGLPAALLYFRAKLGSSHERALAAWTGICLLGMAVPLSALAYGFRSLVASMTDVPGAAAAMLYLAVFLLADFPAALLPQALLARKSYRAYFFTTLAFQSASFAALVIPAVLTGDVETIFFWFVVTAYARLVVTVGWVAVGFEGGLSRAAFSLREMFSYGVPLAMSALVGKLNQQLDKYIVAAIAAAEAFAFYSVGALELPVVQTLAYAVTQAILPSLVERHQRGDREGFVELWHASMVRVAAALMPTFWFVVIMAEPLVVAVFSAEYRDAAIPFRIYAALLPLRLCGYGAIVRALGRTRPVLWSALFGLTVNAVLTYPLFLWLGLAGPALATVLTQVGMILWLLAVVRVQLELRWSRVFPLRDVGLTLGVAAVAALPLGVLWWSPFGPVWTLVAGAVVYVPVYLLLAHRLRIISASDLRYLVDLLTLRALSRPKAT